MSKNLTFLLTLVIAAGMIGFRIWDSKNSPGGSIESLGLQEGGAALSMPERDPVDDRFHFLSAWQTVQIPRAVRFDPPLGSEHSALIYNAQKFWEMNEKRGGHHTGDDLNGIGGMNTDLGDPVFAAADGLVIFAGEPSPGWGNVVVLAHTTPDGKPLHSMYAHMHEILVNIGQLVPRGGKVGTVGTSNGFYPAHLHFEMRTSDGVDIGAGYAMHPLNRLDPTATLVSLRNAAADGLSPSPLGVIASSTGNPSK